MIAVRHWDTVVTPCISCLPPSIYVYSVVNVATVEAPLGETQHLSDPYLTGSTDKHGALYGESNSMPAFSCQLLEGPLTALLLCSS